MGARSRVAEVGRRRQRRRDARQSMRREHTQATVEQLSRVAAGQAGSPAAQRNVRLAIIADQRRRLTTRYRDEVRARLRRDPEYAPPDVRAVVDRQMREVVLPELGFTEDGELVSEENRRRVQLGATEEEMRPL